MIVQRRASHNIVTYRTPTTLSYVLLQHFSIINPNKMYVDPLFYAKMSDEWRSNQADCYE